MQKFEPKKWEIEDCCYIGQLSSYLDQELPKPEMKMVEAHLEDCDDCRFELMQLRQVDIVLRGEEPISPSPEFLINVRTLIKKRKQKPRKFWFNRFKAKTLDACMKDCFCVHGYFKRHENTRLNDIFYWSRRLQNTQRNS